LYYAFVAYDTYIYDPEAKVKGLLKAHDQNDQSDDYPQLLNYAIFKEVDTKRFYVTFRGSVTTSDWLVDLSTAPANMFQSFTDPKPIYVHSGFLSVVQSSLEKIKSTLSDNYTVSEGYTLLVTGHSLGAATAQVFAWLYSKAPVTGLNLDKEIFTFAAPQILWSKPENINPIITSTVVTNVVTQSDIVPRLLGPRTTDLTAVLISDKLGNIASLTPFQKFLQHILNSEGSRILTSYVPGQDNTVVVPTLAGQELIKMSRAEIIKESQDQAKVTVIEDRLCIGTPLKDITVEAHYQSNYLNGFVANKLSTVQDFQGFFIVCAVPDEAPKECKDDKTLYLDVKSDTTVVLQLKASGDRSSQIWNIDSDGYLVNRAYPSKVVGTTTSSDFGLVLVDRPIDEALHPLTAVKWNVKSLYEWFIVATSVSDYVLAAHHKVFHFESITVGTLCELEARNDECLFVAVKNQLWSLQLAHEQK